MEYTVQQNDCLASLAVQHGFAWKTLWNHPQNAPLKQKRKTPNILLPGDILFIPDKKLKEVAAASQRLHKFKKKREKVMFRVRLLEEGEPRRNVEYTLQVGDLTLHGTTNGDGKLEHEIPAEAASAVLTTAEDSHSFQIGGLDPLEEISGLQHRLQNLGYLAESADGELNDSTKAALRDFQQKYNLPVDGELTEATRSKLLEIHGS